MMNFFAKGVAALVLSSMLISCTNESGEFDKQALVGVAGAVGGGLLGSQIGKGSGRTAAIIVGAIGGGLLGSEVGKSLNKADVTYHNRTQSQALEYNRAGTSSSWNNPDTGVRGSITPTKTFTRNDGQYCREFTETIVVEGKAQKGYGTACRMESGNNSSWQIVSPAA